MLVGLRGDEPETAGSVLAAVRPARGKREDGRGRTLLFGYLRNLSYFG